LIYGFGRVDAGLNATGGVNWREHVAEAAAAVEGNLALGVGFGVPHIAELYGSIDGTVSGQVSIERGHLPHGGHEAARSGPEDVEISGMIAVRGSVNLGVRVGSGILDLRYQAFALEIGSLTFMHYRNGVASSQRPRWQWSSQVVSILRNIENAFHEVMEMRRRAEMSERAVAQQLQALMAPQGWFNAFGGGGGIQPRR
jgi:hypothetical protein